MFYYLLTYSLFLALLLMYLAKVITFLGKGLLPDKNGIFSMTDQEKMLIGTSKLKLFYWPSKIHSIQYSRAQLREIWTILINIVSKLLNSKDEFVNIFLSLISNFGCTILIYFILNFYFSSTIAFFGAALYASSVWSYQICLYFGHILLSQFFFFLFIFFLCNFQFHTDYSYLYLVLSGFFLVICFSSSSASRKYPPMIFIFLLFIF